MNTQLLQIHGVSKQFPGVRALSDVSFTLAAGEVHALVGQNGAGKSTLMKILAGIQSPDAGTVAVDGRTVSIDGPRAAQALGISIIHQELSLMPDLTIAENIFIGRERRRGLGLFIDDADLNERARELFDQLGVALDPRAKVGSLVVAQQQVVEIVKALSFDARILIMDEPTAALTVTEAEALFGLIHRLKSGGTGIVYISHRLEELAAVADRITVLRDGACVGTMDADGADLRQVITMMVGHQVEGEIRPQPRPADPTVVLEVRGLSTKARLKDVSFELRRGEILGLAGLMGAGRTEVARAIIGADRTTAGERNNFV